MILYESPKRIHALVRDIAKIAPEREIFAIKEISKKFEKKFKASAKALEIEFSSENLNGEWCVVIAAKKCAKKESICLNKGDIMALNISAKDKARLLARFGEASAKQIYKQIQGL